MILKNENLTIRSARIEDAELLTKWWNDGSVMAHAGFPKGLGQSLGKTIAQIRENKHLYPNRHRCMIEIDGERVGEMSFLLMDSGAADIGIKICEPKWQDRGYGSKLLRMLVKYLFEDEKVNQYISVKKVILDTCVENERAQHVYEKIGFVKLRVNECAWEDATGKWRDSVDYEMTREWYEENVLQERGEIQKSMGNFVIEKSSEEDKKLVLGGLLKYNDEAVPDAPGCSGDISRKVVDEHGKIVAGLIGMLYWGCAYVEILWVDKEHRKDGIGSLLLKEIEQEVKEKGGHMIHLDTFDFQAKDFYLKNGFEIFGILDDCPEGHKRYYLKKTF